MKENIILIGMPGAGKSTVGVVLAKKLGRGFVDSDLVIQERYGKLLHELIQENGVEGFWRIEEEVNASLSQKKCVIATGGSVIYGPKAMEHLRGIGTVVYLQLPCEEVAERLGDLDARGVTLKPGQTLKDLYRERTPLYEKYAHITITCSGKMLRQIVEETANAVARHVRRMQQEGEAKQSAVASDGFYLGNGFRVPEQGNGLYASPDL